MLRIMPIYTPDNEFQQRRHGKRSWRRIKLPPTMMHHETASTTLRGDRSENQDRCAVLGDGPGILLLLADGMGGHARGELAAATFIDSLGREFRDSRDAPAPLFLERAFAQAHLDIVAAGRAATPPCEPRTTGVACLVTHDRACWAHVGDSRLYLLRNDAVQARTLDHSLVEELVQLGELAEADRERHPLRNYVTRALGGPQMPAASLSTEVVLQPGDVLLLCSDGLWAAQREARLLELLHADLLQDCVERLAAGAVSNSAPASDNVTLVALRCRSG
jgi:serine/threonine protein phosphatase PrpC